MSNEELRALWQDVIRRRYPGVILKEIGWPPGEEDDSPRFGVYMIPDGQVATFFPEFFMKERRQIMEKENIPDADFSPRGVTYTRRHLPSVWREAMAERKKSASASTRSPRKSKPRAGTSNAKKVTASR